MREVINFVDRLTVLCFTAKVRFICGNLWFVSSGRQLSAPLVSKQCVPSCCSILWSNVCFCTTPTWNLDLLENVWGSGCTDPRILDLGTSWRWVVCFTSRPLYPRRKISRNPLDRRLGGLQNRSGRREEKNLAPTGTRTPIARPSSP
jgi:hypothetical protein